MKIRRLFLLLTFFLVYFGLITNAAESDIKGELKFRRVNFRSKLKIVGPSEAFKELVTIDSIKDDLNEVGKPAEWTKVIIKDRIVQQE